MLFRSIALIRSIAALPLCLAPILAQAPPRDPLTPAQVAQLQETVSNDPSNLQAHLQLAFYYGAVKQGTPFVQEVLWLINNHPDAASVSSLVSTGPDSFTTAADYAAVKAAWDSALSAGTANARADYNAALFLQSSDVARAAELLAKAHELDPQNEMIDRAEAAIYVKAFAPNASSGREVAALSPEQANALRAALTTSSDAMLVGRVGESLSRDILPPQACDEACKPANDALKNAAWQLLQQAINLQPDNARWQTDLNMSRRKASGQLDSVHPQRVGGQVMEANLVKKVTPVYPPLALTARVQGTVEFTATIDETGHVVDLQLLRGHPILVNAARDAVLQYAYRPTLLNGQPVPVITDVLVNFTLPPAQ